MSEYTPEQLRDWAKVEEEMGEQEGPVRAKLRQHVADQLRAHAAALEARQAAEVRVRMTAQAERIQIERAQRAEAELASVKAHAEASGDEVVRELQRVVLPSLRDYGQGYSAAVAERAASHIIALRAELASVSGHAEAMAVTLDSWARLDGGCKCAALDAYRAAHPKDAP